MTTINDIPFSYLVSWANKNRSSHPELSYLRTLVKKPGAEFFGKWEETRPLLTANVSLNKLKNALERCKDSIIRDFDADHTIIVLPENASDYVGFYERIKAFISQYRVVYSRNAGNYTQNQLEDRNNYATIIKETFEYSRSHPEPTDREIIATHLGLTSRQGMEQILKKVVVDCRDLLSGEKKGNLIVDPVVVSEFAEIRNKVGRMISKESFLRLTGIDSKDEKTLEFLAMMLDRTVQKSGKDKDFIISVIAERGLLRNCSRQLGEMIKYFRKEVFNIRMDFELKSKLRKTIHDDNLRDALSSLFINSDEFVKYDVNDNQRAVTLRWDYLRFLEPRLCWILYENDAIDEGNAISRARLVHLYNDYARRFGDKRITVQDLATINTAEDSGSKLMALGKSGYWKIRMGNEKSFNMDTIIRNYMKEKGSDASFDDFLHFIAENGQARLYPERSWRARYTALGGSTGPRIISTGSTKVRISAEERDKRRAFIIRYLNSLGATCSSTDLFQEFIKEFPGTNIATVGSYIKELYNAKRINAILGSGRRPTYISALTVTTTIPRSVKDDVVDEALDIIWAASNHEIPSQDLVPTLIKHLPATVNSPNAFVSRALHDDSRFVFMGKGKQTIIGLSQVAKIEMAKKGRIVAAPEQKRIPFSWDRLKEGILRQVFRDKTDPGIASTLDVVFKIIRVGSEELPINSSFEPIRNPLFVYVTGSTTWDDRYRLQEDLLLYMEAYFKSFYYLKYGDDLDGTKGFGDLRYFFVDKGIFPDSSHYLSKEELVVSRIIERINTQRNKKAHPGILTEQSDKQAIQNIHDCFALMVYLAGKL